MKTKDVLIAIVVLIIILILVKLISAWNKKYAKVKSVTTLEVCHGDSKIEELDQPHISTQPIAKVSENEYRAFNPSVTLFENELLYSYRISNYTACPASSGKPRRPIFASNESMKSYIMLSDKEGNVVQVNLPERGFKGCCAGFEDARLITSPSGSYFYMIANARMGEECISQMHLIKIPTGHIRKAFKSASPRILNVQDSQIIPLHYDDGSEKPHHEKNWMPFFASASKSLEEHDILKARGLKRNHKSEDDLHFVYSVNPHVILKCDTDTGECVKTAETFNPNIDKNLRGSSQVRMYKGKYIAVAHIRTSSHSYLSQVYTFSPHYPYAVEEISPSFIFDDEKKIGNSLIQFVSGFEIKDDIAYITYGEHDCDSKLFTTSMESLSSSLKKVEQTKREAK
jgi:hypothetical protein